MRRLLPRLFGAGALWEREYYFQVYMVVKILLKLFQLGEKGSEGVAGMLRRGEVVAQAGDTAQELPGFPPVRPPSC